MRLDPGKASYDCKLTVLDVLARMTKYLIGSPISWRRALQAFGGGGVNYSALVSSSP
jgi:hypothetical protein